MGYIATPDKSVVTNALSYKIVGLTKLWIERAKRSGGFHPAIVRDNQKAQEFFKRTGKIGLLRITQIDGFLFVEFGLNHVKLEERIMSQQDCQNCFYVIEDKY